MSLSDSPGQFIGSVQEQHDLYCWINEFTRAVNQCSDNSGKERFMPDLRALLKVLSAGNQYVDCLRPSEAGVCSELIGKLHCQVAILLEDGLDGFPELSKRQARAIDTCNTILNFAVPHFQHLAARIRGDKGKSDVKQGGDSSRPHRSIAIVSTTGDLWKALSEGKTPCIICSSFSISWPFGPNIMQPEFPQSNDQSKWNTLEQALTMCDAEGGDPAKAMQKLIACVARAKRVDRRKIINMPLAEFVAAAEDPRGPTGGDSVNDDAFLGHARIAESFGVPKNALEQRLKRWRANNKGDGWIENTERKPREPKYLYRVGAVRELVIELQQRATGETTGERPAKHE